MKRRAFIKSAVVASAVPGLLSFKELEPAIETFRNKRPSIGIQIPAVSFFDEGVDQVLDNIQKIGVNTVYITVLAYANGLAGRLMPGNENPFPDHGKQIIDHDFFGGYFASINPEYHTNELSLKFRSPDLGDYDVMAAVLPKAHARGLKIYAFMADNINRRIPGVEKLTERGISGNPSGLVCMNNPIYKEILFGFIKDCLCTYPVDGFLYRSERLGPLNHTLGLTHLGFGQPVCFCDHCLTKSKSAGIKMERGIAAYQALLTFVDQSRNGKKPNDGFLTEFYRLLIKYPSILEWQKFQIDSMFEMYQLVYNHVKSLRPDLPTGWAVSMNHNINPLYRADLEWHRFAPFTDFLKVLAYHNVAGPRMVRYIENGVNSLYGDFSHDQLLDWHYKVLGYQERSFDQIAFTGFSSNFVAAETRRAVSGFQHSNTKVYMGIDAGLPTDVHQSKLTPDSLKRAVIAAFLKGADGIILSRKYSEMELRVLAGAGEALREMELL